MTFNFGKELDSIFGNLTKHMNHPFYEQELFTKLQDSLIIMNRLRPTKIKYNTTLVHGGRSQVTFISTKGWVVSGAYKKSKTGRVRRELADAFYLIYDEIKAEARFFLMQYKKEEDLTRMIGGEFEAELLQHELFSSNIPFKYKGINYNFLLSPKVKSITSYGVFYTKGNHYDMLYASADIIKPKIIPSRSCKSTVSVDTSQMNLLRNSRTSYEDYAGVPSIEQFGNALIDLKIGEPIDFKLAKSISDSIKGLKSSNHKDNENNFLIQMAYNSKNIIVISINNDINGLN